MLGETTLQLHRTAAGTHVNGVWVPGAVTEITIRGSLQPINARELALLPEGERTRGRWKLYTRTPLRTANPAEYTEADRIAWQGRTLTVVQVRDYAHVGGSLAHYRADLVEEEVL